MFYVDFSSAVKQDRVGHRLFPFGPRPLLADRSTLAADSTSCIDPTILVGLDHAESVSSPSSFSSNGSPSQKASSPVSLLNVMVKSIPQY